MQPIRATDVSEKMIEIAVKRARYAEITNVESGCSDEKAALARTTPYHAILALHLLRRLSDWRCIIITALLLTAHVGLGMQLKL